MRQRIVRWNLCGPELRMGRRAVNRLAQLRRLVPPRVSAAVLSTLWNRWCTARRFQRQGVCVLGCKCAEDSIEHYASCPMIRCFGWTFLRLHWLPQEGLLHLLVLHGALSDDSSLCRAAILTYAAWRTTETLRRAAVPQHNDARRMLEQYAREAVRGHPSAAAMLDTSWAM